MPYIIPSLGNMHCWFFSSFCDIIALKMLNTNGKCSENSWQILCQEKLVKSSSFFFMSTLTKPFFSLLKSFRVLEYCVLKWVVKKSWKSGFCNKALPIWEIYPPVLIRRVKYCFSALDKDGSGVVVEIGYELSDTPYRYGNGVEVLGT